MRKSALLPVIGLSALLAGCHIMYRPTVQQGNVITSSMIKKLHLGMSKNEVAYTMGEPAIRDPFHRNRWDYYYLLKRNYKPLITEHFTLYFQNGKLARIVGTPTPTPQKTYEHNHG